MVANKSNDEVERPLKTDSATVAGLWVGIFGALLALASIGFSLYVYFEKSPSVFMLTFSGWIAAALGMVALTALLYRQVGVLAALAEKIAVCRSRNSELESRIRELQLHIDRITTVSEFLATRSLGGRARPRARGSDAAAPADSVATTKDQGATNGDQDPK